MTKFGIGSAATGLTVAAMLIAGGSASAGIVTCNAKPSSGPLKGLVVVSSAANMTCAQALADVRKTTSFPKTFRTGGGFVCAQQRAKVHAHTQWRCVKGAKAYRFETTP